MPIKLTAIVCALSCALFAASCVASPEAPTEAEPSESQGSAGAETATSEPTGDGQEPVLGGKQFASSDFPFHTIVPDSGSGRAGGWQEAKAILKFGRASMLEVTTWQCPLTVKMPLRAEGWGPVTPSRAAYISATLANEQAQAMDYDLPPGIFCFKFRTGLGVRFKSVYPGLAQVSL